MDNQLLLAGCGAGAVALLVYFVVKLMAGNEDDDKLRGRLTGTSAKDYSAPKKTPSKNLKQIMAQVGQAAAKPFMPKTREAESGMRLNLNRAGLYSPTALKVIVGCKVIFLAVGVIGGYVVGLMMDKVFLGFALGGIIGYIGPQFWLKNRIKRNQKALTHGLADALDLMVVCVEAGLTVDAAMQRVGSELHMAHEALAREFGIAHMETRVGLSRADAMRNLGIRTGNPSLQSLASMLIQAERFGTSIAQALRIYAETLRLNRQYAAEEMAAKASVKISFPLVLFIFPSTFIVLCGPTILELMHSSIMN
jgi:tight adherence protein C